MIEINLLPEEMRKKQPRFKSIDVSALKSSGLALKDIPVKRAAVIAVSSLVAFHALLLGINFFARGSIASSRASMEKIAPQKKEYDLLKSQSELINKKVSAIDDLMVKRFSWAKKLNNLSDSMTSGIWLSELLYDERMDERPAKISADAMSKKESARARPDRTLLRYLIISGYASSMGEEGTALIGKFIKNLKESGEFFSDFGNIELGSIKSDRVQDQEVMSFRITCLFKDQV
jgi:hypothetical protein